MPHRSIASNWFELSVDEAGQFLVCPEPVDGAELVIGHLRGRRADLPFLADVGAQHAKLDRRSGLRTGEAWHLTPLAGELVLLDGLAVGSEGVTLTDGAEVELAVNLSFRYELPDPGSTTAILRLGRGATCGDSTAIVLLGRGPGGRLRMGRKRGCHIPVPRLEEELDLWIEGRRLILHSASGVQHNGQLEESEVGLPCPPPRRVDVSVGKVKDGRPPFALCIAATQIEAPRAPSGAVLSDEPAGPEGLDAIDGEQPGADVK